MKKNLGIIVVGVIIIFISFTGCSSMIRQQTTIKEIDQSIPTSGSPYILIDNTIISPGEYKIVKDFSIEHEFKQPINKKKAIPLDLSALLKDQAKIYNAKAVVNLRIGLISVDTSVNTWILLERFLGFIAAGYSTYAFIGNDTESGLIFGGLAGLGIGGSIFHKSNAKVTYIYSIEGDLITY